MRTERGVGVPGTAVLVAALVLLAGTEQARAAVALRPPIPGGEPALLLLFEEQPTGAGTAQFLGRGQGYRVRVGSSGAVISWSSAATALGITLVGADSKAPLTGQERTPSRVNYLRGADPSKWRVGVPLFGRVVSHGAYPGIDVAYHGDPAQLEYDFLLAPGADPGAIRIVFEGADSLRVHENGDLLLRVGATEVVQRAPVAYQETAAGRRLVTVGYRLGEGAGVRIALGAYDPRAPLVIDPVVVYSSHLGGAREDRVGSIALDAAGSLYLAGRTDSADFPTAGPVQGGVRAVDAFVTKLTREGALVYSTFLGGSGTDLAEELAVDASGSVYFTGVTTSADFPTRAALQPTLGGLGDAFVTKLTPEGDALVFSTYLGSTGSERGNGIALGPGGDVYVAGFTNSVGFPTTPNAVQPALRGGLDAFVVRLNPAGSAFVYSTFLGGSADDLNDFYQLDILAVDGEGNAYVAGRTASVDFPTTTDAFQRNNAGSLDAFVTKINPSGTSLVYSTYLGGSSNDVAVAIALDGVGNAHVVGTTFSSNFPVTPGAFDNTPGPCCLGDGFLSKLNSGGTALVFSTFLGGSGQTAAMTVVVDDGGSAHVSGYTRALDFPLVAPVQSFCSSCPTWPDAFVMKFDPQGASLLFSSYLGGQEWDAGNSLALDAGGSLYVAGEAFDTFPTTPGSLQPAFQGGVSDGFFMRIQLAPACAHLVLDVSGYFEGNGNFFTVSPCRLVDTRDPLGPRGGPELAAGITRAFTVAGACGVPLNASAVSLNLTAVQPTAAGNLRLYAAGSPLPLVSSLNFSSGQTRGNNAIATLNAEGRLAALCAQ